MPSVSEKQHRAMEAAAHGHSTLGIPKSVGEEFVRADAVPECAGMLLRAGRKFLLVKRVENGLWEQPGGHIEKGETAKQAAEREAEEEVGKVPVGKTVLAREMKNKAVSYTTFLRDVPEFQPTLSDEHTDWAWVSADQLPGETHPEVRASILEIDARKDAQTLTDHDVVKAIRDGAMTSPQKLGDMWLFDLRITGTGVAYRSAHDEYAFRDPDVWLTDEFLERCNGLAVVFDHPETQGLTSDEFRQRSIGTIVMPYRKGDEVWGVAKIYDADAAELMQVSHVSTSPGVMHAKGANETIQTDNGDDVLIEGAPLVLDHLAVCRLGVWDKGGEPTGIRLDTADGGAASGDGKDASAEGRPEAASRKDAQMADEKEAREDAQPDFAMIMDAVSKLAARMDAIEETRKDAKKDEMEGETAAKAAEEAAKMDKKDSKKDAAEEERKDADCDMDKKDERKDAVDVTALMRQVQALQTQLAGVSTERTFADREAIGAAYRRADSVFQMHGMHTPEAIPGETPIAYRQRLAAKLQKFSKQFSDHRLDAVMDPRTFDLVENQIYADADTAARSPDNMPAGRLIPHTSNVNGHQVTKFYGDSAAAWGFFQPPLRLVGGPRVSQKGQ